MIMVGVLCFVYHLEWVSYECSYLFIYWQKGRSTGIIFRNNLKNTVWWIGFVSSIVESKPFDTLLIHPLELWAHFNPHNKVLYFKHNLVYRGLDLTLTLSSFWSFWPFFGIKTLRIMLSLYYERWFCASYFLWWRLANKLLQLVVLFFQPLFAQSLCNIHDP